MRPGVNTYAQSSAPARAMDTDTGKALAVVVAERGPTGVVVENQSMNDYVRNHGSRNATTALSWDGAERYFKAGGRRLKTIRAVGPAAAKATLKLYDGSGVTASDVSLEVEAVGEGTWYNGIQIAVTDSGTSRAIRVSHATDTSVLPEQSLFYDSLADLVSWAKESRYIRLKLGVSSEMPTGIAATPLAGGANDDANITDAVKVAALDRFTNEAVGLAGQVAIPGGTSQAIWTAILSHCATYERTAILACPDTADEATLTALANAMRALGVNGGAFANWLIVRDERGQLKTVEPSLAVCGRIGAHDGATGGLGQNKPVAGRRRGLLDDVVGLTQQWTDQDMITRLNEAGINLIRWRPAGATIYGWRTLADAKNAPNDVNLGHRRLQNAIMAKASVALEDFVFEEIDGEGKLYGDARGAITAILMPYYNVGSLYGTSPDEAFRVYTDGINTDETAQNRELHVGGVVVESEFAEQVNFYLIKNLITEGVGA